MNHVKEGDEWFCKQTNSSVEHSRVQQNNGYCPYCHDQIEEFMY